MIFPRTTLMLMGIVVISCIHPFLWPSVGLSLSIANKSFGRKGRHLACWYTRMTYPHRASIPMGIIVISCVHPSIQLSMSLGFGIADKSLGRKVYILACWCIQMICLQFIDAYRYYCPSVHLSGRWVRVRVWVRLAEVDGCCHHLGISVAITGSTF